ncbi:hypothetical protein [Streptantibioticus ferralitis]|uniref:Uncharacterized protein n=1 Tax=Streptantibioticus ferralitis TaxID=236510 RepID=A0ABT5Z4V1_9ACTN|nr:hypothetical protein [Streptantibioticus ferralitis]MDF2258601.1 hypothetical protein [Streptantibioticus ferralitis]
MRKRATILLMALIVSAVGIYGIYYVSPYGQHDRQAAAYERTFRARMMSVGDVRITSGDHQVSGNRWGEGGECSLLATLEVNTPLGAQTFEDRLKTALTPYTDEYVHEQVTRLSDRDGNRVFRVEAGTLVDGGSLDLRCG